MGNKLSNKNSCNPSRILYEYAINECKNRLSRAEPFTLLTLDMKTMMITDQPYFYNQNFKRCEINDLLNNQHLNNRMKWNEKIIDDNVFIFYPDQYRAILIQKKYYEKYCPTL